MAKVEFFDIANKASRTWSPNTALTRMVLNYKGIPHKTTWLSYPDIAPTLKSLGVPPALDNPRVSYTCPAIRHGEATLMDSWSIALYLDRTFDGTGESIFPTPGALPLAKMVHYQSRRALKVGMKLLLPHIPSTLDERGAAYFRATREQWFGKPPEQLLADGEAEGAWAQVEEEMAILADLLSGRWSSPKGLVVERDGPFFLGARPSYADFILVGGFQWFKCADEGLWRRLLSLGSSKDDCFRKLWDACEQWLHVKH